MNIRKFKDTFGFDKCVAIGGTDKAVLVLFPSGDQHWMPKSQIDDDSEIQHRGDEGTLIVSKWICEQKNLTAGAEQTNRSLTQKELDLSEPYKLYRDFIKDFHPDVRTTPIDATEVTARVTSLWRAMLKAGGKR